MIIDPLVIELLPLMDMAAILSCDLDHTVIFTLSHTDALN